MRAVVQRVKRCQVTIDSRITGKIGPGILLLLGVGSNDDKSDIDFLVDKVLNLRIFEDEQGKMNLSLLDVKGELLVVSQFTLFGDCRKGRRPSFTDSAEPEFAKKAYEDFVRKARERGVHTQTGEFAAMMDVELVNAGPVTFLIDSKKIF